MRALAVAAAAWLAGCAAQPVGAPEEPRKYKPLSAYAADPFAPVNLYMNANEHAAGTLAMLVEHSAARLRDSGAFVRVDRGVQRWPITIQARYGYARDTGPGDRRRRVLSALTLGLVPVRVSHTHTLFVEVFAEPEDLAALELSLTVGDRVSLYDLGDNGAAERAAADALLERLLAEIAQRKLIPRWATFEPDPEPVKRRKKRTPGRAT